MQFGLPAAISAAGIVVTPVLVPAVGIAGVGWAWLSTQSVAAAAILLYRRRVRRPASPGTA